MVRILCLQCRLATDYSGVRPKFCQHCGASLGDTDPRMADTLPGTPSETAAERPVVPSRLGEYSLIRLLGGGGMGVVHEAEHVESKRRVAVKVLSPSLAPTTETVERFIREGRLAASVSHPRSTFVLGAHQDEGQLYIVMELMPGQTLKDVVDAEGPLPVGKAVDAILDVIEGLEAAHALDVVHRDVKPSNCFVDREGRIKVGDFGLSKSVSGDAGLTRTGTFLGTPQFAAPEQIRGAEVDARTDVYGVGATLFYLLAGRPHFTGESAAVIAQISSEAAPPISQVCSGVPKTLDRIIATALARDPADRHQTLGDLRALLTPFASQGTSIADVGRRLAAFFLDFLVVSLCVGIGGGLLGLASVLISGRVEPVLRNFNLGQWLAVIGIAGYFAVGEGLYGRCLGKKLLGLSVVGPYGEPPGLALGVIRAAILPGTYSTVGVLATTISPQLQAAYIQGPSGNPQSFAIVQLLSYAGWAVTLLLLCTMRKRNGFRGVHEFVSGTRTVRPRTGRGESPFKNLPVRVPTASADEKKRLGPFEVSGEFAEVGEVRILHARDEVLKRPVWIHLQSGPPPWPGERLAVSRPGRPFWLQGGMTEGRRWDAFEAVVGVPLADVGRHGDKLGWVHSRWLLKELADELLAAVDDGTLPSPLTLSRVWVERSGRIKLLDVPLSAAGADAPPEFEHVGEPAERAVGLLRRAADVCRFERVLPGHAHRFVVELGNRPSTSETLTWAAAELAALVERPARLRWDDRLAVLAASVATEFAIMVGLIQVIGFAIYSPTVAGAGVAIAACASVGLAIAGALGAGFRGGPVFWFTGIEVRLRNGAPASRVRCAWRNVLAWLPLLLGFSALIGMGVMGQSMQQQNWGADAKPERIAFSLMIVASACGCTALMPLFGLGTVYAVFSPRRGIQDRLAGTSLTLK